MKRRIVLYVNFGKPSCADGSGLTYDDIIIRRKDGPIVELMFFNAAKGIGGT